jgi:hypothetical protein
VLGPGKRTDALLRTSGSIRSLVFAEIKHHLTDLLGLGSIAMAAGPLLPNWPVVWPRYNRPCSSQPDRSEMPSPTPTPMAPRRARLRTY